MYYTIAVDLIVLWLLGLFVSFTFGGIIYILPVIALVMILSNIISERRMIKSTINGLKNLTDEENKI
jgi:hypothetical protein